MKHHEHSHTTIHHFKDGSGHTHHHHESDPSKDVHYAHMDHDAMMDGLQQHLSPEMAGGGEGGAGEAMAAGAAGGEAGAV